MLCAMVEVADMVILIKKGHVELDFAKTEFCTNFFFFLIFFFKYNSISTEFYDKFIFKK